MNSATELQHQITETDSKNSAARFIDEAIARTAREVQVLREYTARLVNDAVLGRLDVRGLAPALSDSERDVGVDVLTDPSITSCDPVGGVPA